MPHLHNARADRYAPARTNTTHRVSHTETPFCDVDARGHCRNSFHSHAGPVRKPRRWLSRRKV
jgi:hypothetical protein